MKSLLKIVGIILLIGLAVSLWPIALGGGIAWYVWKKHKIPSKKVRYLTIACLLFAGVFGTGWVAALHGNAPTSSETPTTQIAVAKPTETPLSYKVLYITTDKDNNGQIYSKHIYALETPKFAYDEAKITELLAKVQRKECESTLDSCVIDLYDNQHFADESHAFDLASVDDQTNFDETHHDFNSLNAHHFVANRLDGKVTFYPLFTTIAPAQSSTTSTQSQTPPQEQTVTQTINNAGSGLSNTNSYINSDGNQVHSPAYSTNGYVPAGATAQCEDGTYSFSQHHSGTCSHHGGVSQWYQ